MIAGGVTLSVIVSPVVAAVTVGKNYDLVYLPAVTPPPSVSQLIFVVR